MFLKKKEKFISLMLKHIGTSALMDLLLRLVSCVEPVGLRQEVLHVSARDCVLMCGNPVSFFMGRCIRPGHLCQGARPQVLHSVSQHGLLICTLVCCSPFRGKEQRCLLPKHGPLLSPALYLTQAPTQALEVWAPNPSATLRKVQADWTS